MLLQLAINERSDMSKRNFVTGRPEPESLFRGPSQIGGGGGGENSFVLNKVCELTWQPVTDEIIL